MTIVMISLASAMYAGDCLLVDLSNMTSLDNVIYDVVGNESNMTGLRIDLNQTSGVASICTAVNYKPDSFTIIFIDNSTKERVVVHYSGGGGGGGGSSTKYETEYVYRNITEYIDADDEITIDEFDDESKFNVVPWIFLGLMVVYLFISVLSSVSKARKAKQAEVEEQDTRDWKIVEDKDKKEDNSK